MKTLSVAAALTCRGVAKSYRTFGRKPVVALNGINLCVPKGSICALLGPNGAGKSTLFKVMSGLLRPDAGTVDTGSFASKLSSRPRLVYTGEGTLFHPQLSVRQILLWFSRWGGLTGMRSEQRVEEVLGRLELTAVQHRRYQACSRGMRQRLGLGVCLVQDPDILLLDEPASGLDPLAWQSFLLLLDDLRRVGKTILFSSHHLHGLVSLCDQVVMLRRGQVIVQGTPRELLAAWPEGSSLEAVYLHHLSSTADDGQTHPSD